MLIDIKKIKVEDRIRKDLGNIQELADDIKQNGLINPPVVVSENDGTFTLLAGERRLRAMHSLGYKQIEVRTWSSLNDEQKLNIEISENEVRKDFSKAERIEYARKLEKIESLKAKVRQATSTGGGTPQLVKNFPQADNGTVRDIVAKKLGIGSGKQYEKEKYIADNKSKLTPEDFVDWDEGKLSTNKAYMRIKEQLKEKDNQIAGYRQKLNNMQSKYLEQVNSKIETLQGKIRKLTNDKVLLQDKLKLTEKENGHFQKLQNEIKYLTQQKEDLGRQIDSVTELSGLTVEIKNLLENKLAPIKYKRCIDVLDKDSTKIALNNIIEILNKIDEWSKEMHHIVNKSDYVDVEIN